MTLKEFIDKIIKLKQENPEISECIEYNYCLESFKDKDKRGVPVLYFWINKNNELETYYDYDFLSAYMNKEVKEIEYNGELGKTVYIDAEVMDEYDID